ncbi:MAG TPA: hypothetical protein VD886_05055, partial [Herpetosiphonaceae bacterium]|nr:hypothetical protein [Herpetosiphonaceae bacterium]
MRPGRWTTWLMLAPALGLLALLFGSSVLYGVAQSLGWLPFLGQRELSLGAYRNVLAGPQHAGEFWRALLFSLWVSGAATLLSALIALVVAAILAESRAPQRRALTLLNLNLAFPHLVWAVGLSLLLAQSGLLARIAAALGWIDGPAEFPVLIRDRFGLGVILAYVGKEVPFLLLIALSILRSQPVDYAL